MSAKIAFTRITSYKTISKGFRLRGQGLEKIGGGSMYAGFAERLDIENLQELVPIILKMTTRQAMAYGTVKLPGARHEIVTKAKQMDGQNIARAREFFEFREGEPGLFLIDYDPAKDETPLPPEEVLAVLAKVSTAVGDAEKLLISSASSYIYRKSDDVCMKGAGGLHILMRASNAAEIPAIGEALNARLWFAGLGRITRTSDGKQLVRSLIDTTVWQPERLFYEAGADCGPGLIQRRPPFQYFAGGAISLSDIDLTPDEWDTFHEMVAKAKGGPTPPKPRGGGKNPAIVKKEREAARAANPVIQVEPLTPSTSARIMGALLYISPEVDYQTWLRLGMSLKNSYGDAAFDLWDNWSKPGSKYPGTANLRAKWLTFGGGRLTIRTLYHLAKENGWTPHTKWIELPLPVRELPESEHEPLATAVHIDSARDETADFFKKVILDPTPGTVSSAQITVGTGKTTTLKELFFGITMHNKKVLNVAKDKQQAAAYEKAGAFWRHGRECMPEGFASPWHCPHAVDGGNVQRLAEAEHRLHQMCRGGHCAHGNAFMLKKAERDGREPDEKAVRFFKERPELKDAEPCGWFDHLADSQSRDIRVVTGAGVSQADMLDAAREDVDVIVVDEALQWSHSQFLDVPGIRKYVERLQEMRAAVAKQLADADAAFGSTAESFDDDESLAIFDAPAEIFAELSAKLGQQAGTGKKGEYQPIAFDIADIAAKLETLTDDRGVALWEKPSWKHWTDLVQAPLRALSAIRAGITANSLSIVDGKLHITYLHPLLEHAMREGIAVVILDATLAPTARALSTEIKKIVAEPNVDFVCDPRWFFSAKNDAKSLKKEARLVRRTLDALEKKTGHAEPYVICRMALAHYMLAEKEGIAPDEFASLPRDEKWRLSIGAGIGWWGWHDAAHDKWKGRDGLLWGQIPVPDDVRMQQYADYRAAMLLMGKCEDLPLPSGRWVDRAEVGTGDHVQISQARLPDQPEVRGWLLRVVSDQRVQAAGRSRAVCQDFPITIWQAGGYPVTGLAEHGIRVKYERLVPSLSRDEITAVASARRHRLMDEAAALAVSRGEKITRDRLRAFTNEICKSLITDESKSTDLVRSRYIYIYQPRTKSEHLERNENNELQEGGIKDADDGEEQKLFTDETGVWDHEYATWREAAHAGLRSHFAHDREAPVMPIVDIVDSSVVTDDCVTVPDMPEAAEDVNTPVETELPEPPVSVTVTVTPEVTTAELQIVPEHHAPALAAYASATLLANAVNVVSEKFGFGAVQEALAAAEAIFAGSGGDAGRIAKLAHQTQEYHSKTEEVSDAELAAVLVLLSVLEPSSNSETEKDVQHVSL